MKAALVWRHGQERPPRAPAASTAPAAPPASSSFSSASLDGPCHCLCYSPDGSRLVAGVGSRVLVFDADGAAATAASSSPLPPDGAAAASAPSCRHSLRGHGGSVLAVAHAAAAGRFASGDATGTVVVWTGGGQPVLRYSHGAGGLPLLVEEQRPRRGGGQEPAAAAAAAAAAAQAPAEPILALAWSACPSQPRLASVSPTELALWDPGASREVVKVPLLPAPPAGAAALAAAAAAPRATRAAAWSPGGGRVLALGLSDGSVSLRDGCAGGAELRRVRLGSPGPGGAAAAAGVLAVVWLRAGEGGGGGSGGGGLSGAALAVSTADGRLHEVVLLPGSGGDGEAAPASRVRSWHLGSGMAAAAASSAGSNGCSSSATPPSAWGNAVSVSLFCPGAGGSPSPEEDQGAEKTSGSSETLLLLGGACGRVSLVAWRPPASPLLPPPPPSSSTALCPFFDLGPFWWPGDFGGASPPAGTTSAGECPDWVWSLAQRPGGCAYSAIPALAGAATGAALAAPPAAAAPLPAHLPVAHVAVGRHDGSVSVVAAHLPKVHALHLSGEHGHVYAAREGLTSVSVRRLRVATAATTEDGGGAGWGPRSRRRAEEAAGVGVLRFGELVQRVGVYGARVAVQLRGRVEVFERRRRRQQRGGGIGGIGCEDGSSSSDGGSGSDGDNDGAWSDEERESLRAARRRLGWQGLAGGERAAAAAAAAAAAGARGAAARGAAAASASGAAAAAAHEGDAYALDAALVPVGAERLLGPLSSRAPGACSLLVVGARHVFLCTGARMAAYAVGAAGAAAAPAAPRPPQQPQQAPEREWAFDSAIRYVRAAGGPPGAETLLVGLRSGAVAAVFADREGAPLPLVAAAAAPPSPPSAPPSPPPGVRCLDLSADRLRLAVVDDSGTCSVYEPFGPALLRPPDTAVVGKSARAASKGGGAPAAALASSPNPPPRALWRVRGAESCAWSDAHPDVLAVSGGGQLAVHFVPLVVGEEAGAAALAFAAAQAATTTTMGAGAAATADPLSDDDDEGGSTASDNDDPAAARRRAAAMLAAAALEEGRLISPPLSAPPPSTQDAGGGLVVGLAGATAFVLLRPSAAAAAAAAAASSSSSSAASSGSTAAPALAALSVPLGAAVRHLARQRAGVPRPPAGGAASAPIAPGLAAARAVACLGASRSDWRLIADEALDSLNLGAAADVFARLRDARGAELAARLGAAAASGAVPPGALRAEVAAWGGRFARASRLFCRAGCPSQAVEMWLAMGRIGPAREVARRCGASAHRLSAAAAGALAVAEAADAQRLRQEQLLELRQRRRRRRRRRLRRGKEGGEGDVDDDDYDDDDEGGEEEGDGDDDGQQRQQQQEGERAPASAAAEEQARALVSRGELEAAVGCLIEHGLWDKLRALTAMLHVEEGGEEEDRQGRRDAAGGKKGGRGRALASALASAGPTLLHPQLLLKRAAAAFASAGRPDDAAALLVRLGDTAALVSLHASAGRWHEAALLAAGGGPALARRAHLPRAAALAARGQWAEAADAYASAGLPGVAGRLLRSLAASAAEAGKFAEAAAWARARADLALCCDDDEEDEKRQRRRQRQEQKFRKRLHAAEAYWAYGLVHEAARQPFAAHPPALVFRAACFVAARGLGGGGGIDGGHQASSSSLYPPPSLRASPGGARRLPHGVSLAESLLAVVRLGPALGEWGAARRAGEFLLGLRAGVGGSDDDDGGEGREEEEQQRVPPLVLTADQQAEVEMAVVCARAAAAPASLEEPPPWCCPRCGTPPAAPPLLAAGASACAACGEPLHVSSLTFERLPLVEFRPDPASGLSASRALALVGRGGFKRCGGGGGDGGSSAATVEPCGALEDQEALERAWARAVRAAPPGRPVLLPPAAIRRLRPREVVAAARGRRGGRGDGNGGDEDDLQLFRLMDGGAVPVAAAASGHFCEQDELEAAVAAERSAAAAVGASGGAPRPPSFLGGAVGVRR